ncbi:hypothetical protein [Enterococcus sp. T0101B.F-10]|uniref:hypothetical protein n=1 Tax=Enterococcus sp. T0101B.F-10 TaxID=2315837 RepID=UPI0021CC59FF|nr:hypothetical protein [Enterococcus sp. T0101B.F-10]
MNRCKPFTAYVFSEYKSTLESILISLSKWILSSFRWYNQVVEDTFFERRVNGMLGIDNEIVELYKKAQRDGEAVIKDRWSHGNYGCCSTRAPLIEKYRIENTETHISLYLWSNLVVDIKKRNKAAFVNQNYQATNYDQKVIDWFINQALKA